MNANVSLAGRLRRRDNGRGRQGNGAGATRLALMEGGTTMAETSETHPIRILIADRYPLVWRGLRSLFALEPGMELVGEAENGPQAVCQARALRPDVVLIDLLLPCQGGLQVIREIAGANPEARILVLTAFTDDEQACSAVQAGALGVLLKDSPARELLRAIREVCRGKR
jgi:DNA-binding NarL/FixJ family response regulator